MNFSKIKRIYNKLPGFLKVLSGLFVAFIPRSVLMGKRYNFLYNQAIKSQYYSRNEINAIQLKLLKKLIKHAYENVPYYTRLFKSLNLSPNDFNSLDDIRKIPFLTKQDIRENHKDLIAKNASQFKPGQVHTSGSTGKSLDLLLDQQNREKEYAVISRTLDNYGINPNCKTANFRGDFVGDFEKKSKLYRYNSMKKELIFSTYDLNDALLKQFIRKLKQFKPVLLKGFPSAIFILSRYMIKNNLELKSVKAILTSSEQLTEEMKESIHSAFSASLIDWYGATEYAVSAATCSSSPGYHINDDFCFTEILDDNNNPVEQGASGRLVVTGLYNYSMPLIRYEQEDTVTLSSEKCPCGRELKKLSSLDGRKTDYIMNTSGSKLSCASVHHFWKNRMPDDIQKIDFYQIIQKSPEEFLVLMTNKESVSLQSVNKMTEQLKILLGESIVITLQWLEKLPPGEKWRHVKYMVKE